MGKDKPQIVLFGDSITQFSFEVDNAGWGAALTNYYARKADVLLRGFGGYNSSVALCLLDSIFPIPSPNKPLLVTVFFGANDACIPNLSQRNLHVPLAEYGENLRKIVTHLKKMSDSTLVVLITPPPIDEKAFLITCEKYDWLSPTNGVCPRTNEQVKLYADECVKVSKETGVPVIDLWSTFMEAPDWTMYLCDGLHLSVRGNTKLFEELLKVVEEPSLVPTLKADLMPIDFTHFLDFGPDPVASLKKHIANL